MTKRNRKPRGRFNLTLTPTIHRAGQRQARARGMSFSHWVEALLRWQEQNRIVNRPASKGSK